MTSPKMRLISGEQSIFLETRAPIPERNMANRTAMREPVLQ
jgi:hypothetical protein